MADDDALQVAVRVCAILEALGIRYAVGGSIASGFAGEPRATIDVDILIELDRREVPALVRALLPEFYVEESAMLRAIDGRSHVNAIHQVTAVKVDLFIAGATRLDDELLRRGIDVSIGPGVRFRVHTPEDILLQKLRWYRMGGEVSDRQWRDVLGIVRVQGARLDREYLAGGAQKLEVADLLDRALREGDGN